VKILLWNRAAKPLTLRGGVDIPPDSTVIALSDEDIEGLHLAVQQARITWGGLGQASLIRRILGMERVFTDALSVRSEEQPEPADNAQVAVSAQEAEMIRAALAAKMSRVKVRHLSAWESLYSRFRALSRDLNPPSVIEWAEAKKLGPEWGKGRPLDENGSSPVR
jgi:hypothetical protein